jgi:hypothetical protein
MPRLILEPTDRYGFSNVSGYQFVNQGILCVLTLLYIYYYIQCLTLSRRVSKYIRHFCPTSFWRTSNYVRTCLFRGSPFIFRSYCPRWQCMHTNVFVNVFSASSCHLEAIVWISWEANANCKLVRVSAFNMASHEGRISPRRLRKRKYNLACVEDEVSLSDILSE